MECEGAAMPANDGGRLHDLDTPAPARPDPGQQHPQESVGATQVGPFRCGLLEDGELVPQGENLGFKLRPRMDTGANSGEERNQNGAHVRTPYQPGAANPERDKAYRISDNHRSFRHARSG